MIDDRFAKRFDEAAAQLGCRLSGMLSQLPTAIKAKTQEIRIRIGQPVVLSSAQGELFLDQNGRTARCCHAGLPKVCLLYTSAKKQKLHVIEAVFRFTADQEKAHAKVYYLSLIHI